MGRDGAFLEIKGRDMRLNHSVPYIAEFNNGRGYIYLPTYARMECTKILYSPYLSDREKKISF
jgi:hypothetical protein